MMTPKMSIRNTSPALSDAETLPSITRTIIIMQTGLGTRKIEDLHPAIFFQMAGGPVSWKIRKQECVALSTAEAEYIALSSAAQETVWIRCLISELGTELEGPTTLMEDNQAAI